MLSKVSTRGQITIPAEIRRRHNITAHTKLEWIDDGHSISVFPVSKDPVKTLRGIIKNGKALTLLLKERKKERHRE